LPVLFFESEATTDSLWADMTCFRKALLLLRRQTPDRDGQGRALVYFVQDCVELQPYDLLI
jgi:hypothetical protein